MSISQDKFRILEAMFLNEKPANAVELARDSGIDLKALRMHLLGLKKNGYIFSPSKGHYLITQKGKEALGIPKTSKECAKTILTPTSCEKAFYFYQTVGKPLNVNAQGLEDFVDRIGNVDNASLVFHLDRGDFEAWFAFLGDLELSAKIALLKKTTLGKALREKLHEVVKKRCIDLKELIKSF